MKLYPTLAQRRRQWSASDLKEIRDIVREKGVDFYEASRLWGVRMGILEDSK